MNCAARSHKYFMRYLSVFEYVYIAHILTNSMGQLLDSTNVVYPYHGKPERAKFRFASTPRLQKVSTLLHRQNCLQNETSKHILKERERERKKITFCKFNYFDPFATIN